MEEKKTTTKAFDELPDDWTCVICGATKEEYENKLAENDGPVTEDDLVAEIVKLYPEAIPILMGVGMHCFGCAAREARRFGTLAGYMACGHRRS